MTRKPKHFVHVYRCRNGQEAVILPSRQPGPRATPHTAFTYAGVLRINGDVPWGIHRWYTTGEYIYNDLMGDNGWDLILDSRRVETRNE